MATFAKRLARRLRRLSAVPCAVQADTRAVAAMEFALMAGTFVLAMLNTVDVARYYYIRMEVQNATQMAAQSAWNACNTPNLPATTKCSGLNAAITSGIQSTSLGSNVALQSGYPTEGYYCVDGSDVLQYVSSVSSKPANCAAASQPNDLPADYINIGATYTYVPYFHGLTVGSLLPTPVTATTRMRLQ